MTVETGEKKSYEYGNIVSSSCFAIYSLDDTEQSNRSFTRVNRGLVHGQGRRLLPEVGGGAGLTGGLFWESLPKF